MRFICSLVLLCLLGVSSFAGECGNKIDSALCLQMANADSATLLPIEIVIPEPTFSPPNKDSVSPDSAKNFSTMMIDSLNRHLAAIKPEIDSLFATYPLYSTTKPAQRILSPNIPYDYFFEVEATASTISALSGDSLVARIASYTPSSSTTTTTTVPEYAIRATTFPFDTIIAGFFKASINLPPEADTITIARYGMKFGFGPFAEEAICPDFSFCADFYCLSANGPIYNRYPEDSQGNYLMCGEGYCYGVDSAPYLNVDSSYKTHEYRFYLDSLTLYMKVTSVYSSDSLKVRFDTVSFLTTSAVRPASLGSNPVSHIGLIWRNGAIAVTGLKTGEPCTISICDVSGKRLFESAVNANRPGLAVSNRIAEGMFVVRISTRNQDVIMKKCLIK